MQLLSYLISQSTNGTIRPLRRQEFLNSDGENSIIVWLGSVGARTLPVLTR